MSNCSGNHVASLYYFCSMPQLACPSVLYPHVTNAVGPLRFRLKRVQARWPNASASSFELSQFSPRSLNDLPLRSAHRLLLFNLSSRLNANNVNTFALSLSRTCIVAGLAQHVETRRRWRRRAQSHLWVDRQHGQTWRRSRRFQHEIYRPTRWCKEDRWKRQPGECRRRCSRSDG